MIRRIRLTLLLVLLTAGMAAVSIQPGAATIGELMGWDTAGESETQARTGNRDTDKDRTGNSDKEKARAGDSNKDQAGTGNSDIENLDIDEDGSYDTKNEVCAYLVRFHRLPKNYMTKKEARKNGWESGALDRVISGKCIGGDHFGNYEGLLPEVDGREYHECDIDTLGKSGRGTKRIVYSGDDENGDWNIYYTEDHYETFELLWGEDDDNK